MCSCGVLIPGRNHFMMIMPYRELVTSSIILNVSVVREKIISSCLEEVTVTNQCLLHPQAWLELNCDVTIVV